MIRRCSLALLALALAGCQQGDDAESGPRPAFDGVKPGETVHFTGTEPFWGGEVAGAEARYSTPEDPTGATIAVTRFAGLNGVSFSGMLEATSFDLMITPGQCSDGMSDRTYPLTATLRLGGETREGCAWTQSRPYTGDEQP